MPPLVVALLLVLAAYLVGAIPVGYLLGRAKGVDLFRVGSGNIGATNVGRVLGRRFGALCFLLDFLKGAGPTAAVEPLARAIDPAAADALGLPSALRVAAAVAAFLGHLFPVYLGFRGGKGVATGAGTVAVLVPGPTALALLAWVVVVLASRYVSLASLVAVAVLSLARLVGTPDPFGHAAAAVTGYCLAGSLLVAVKHRANVRRLSSGTENRIGDFPVRPTAVRALHVLALGFWFGGAGFFSFVVAPANNTTFDEVVRTAPNSRTANRPLLPTGASDAAKKELGSALFGAAVGPVFPKFYAMQLICGGIALATALGWRRLGRVHRRRAWVIAAAVATVLIGWPISASVAEMRMMRYAPNLDVAQAAWTAFLLWHFVSLFLSLVTVVLAGIALAMAAKLPEEQP